MLPRTHWQLHVAGLDPDQDYEEIYRVVVAHEFPWDMNQALSFALFRTFAVPSIGRLLHQTGEFERDPQKRYEDTALLLDEPLRSGLRSDAGLRAIRRVNQMHGAYDISPEDMRYVLATFVVVPKRWMDDHGWRPFTPAEVRASVRYYVELGGLLGIKGVPQTYVGFEDLLTAYEAEHFAFDAGGRRVADATMRQMLSFYPALLRRPVETASRALMDEPLLRAFDYERPSARVVRAAAVGLRARARVEALLPARRRPLHALESPRVRSYPDGCRIEALGTFPRGCPVQPPSA